AASVAGLLITTEAGIADYVDGATEAPNVYGSSDY
ncbi:MAG: 60 kDa chaperonin, partial [Rhizorhabdus sp.]|nr:60 kDa chaperonin [Rhizorhabdus sp.]